ncbi:inositol monophosphatase 2-like [Osmia bicornis bicornis]|uniref:inositol monophosphatase 2-like n=1 Tax=Osmia bicornis bicornis TaxID=1437191 RepID=UPI0010F70930|nr:inositol monophosphatase 2-like [Osmia bicornis bicornis]
MFRFSCLCRLRDSVSLVTKIRGCRHEDRAFDRSVVPSKASLPVIMSSEQDIRSYFETAKELTLKAGVLFKSGFEGQKTVQTKDNEWDLVTEYDKKIEELLTSGLKEKFPDHEFIGEESAAETKEPPVLTDKPTWIIDPIDGTVNFVNSFPFTCISVALSIRKDIVIGIIYNPLSSELYTAIKGQGAFLNDKLIRTTRVTELKKSLIEIELFSLQFPSRNRDIKMGRLEAFIKAARGVRYTGSATLSMAYVAKGALDCFQMDNLKAWDVAAGILLVCEAGGSIMDTKADQYDLMKPNTIAAATETLATEIKQLVLDTDLKILRKRLTKM